MEKKSVAERVWAVAEEVLHAEGQVSYVDVLLGLGWVDGANYARWKQGREAVLEGLIQAGPAKQDEARRALGDWLAEVGLEGEEVVPRRASRAGEVELKYTESGEWEGFYRMVWSRPGTKKKRPEKAKKLELLVYFVHRETACGECGKRIEKGGLVYLEGEKAWCLPCAGMGELEFLPAGDAGLTRRVTKVSARKIVVLEFRRSRGRYERQGLLVEAALLKRLQG